jgi:phytoene dehydrogenase-like protein
MAKPLTVRGIAENAHSTRDYAIVTIRIPGVDTKTGELAEAVVTRELHIVDDLRANILVGIDVMTPEDMDLEISVKSLKIGSCNVKANI